MIVMRSTGATTRWQQWKWGQSIEDWNLIATRKGKSDANYNRGQVARIIRALIATKKKELYFMGKDWFAFGQTEPEITIAT